MNTDVDDLKLVQSWKFLGFKYDLPMFENQDGRKIIVGLNKHWSMLEEKLGGLDGKIDNHSYYIFHQEET